MRLIVNFLDFINKVNPEWLLSNMDYAILSDFKCALSTCGEELDSTKFVGVYFQTGGMSGGSCWDGYAQQYETSYGRGEEPVFENLINILSAIYIRVDTNSKKYIDFISEYSRTLDYTTSSDYYGNCTDYRVRYVKLKDIYSYFVLDQGVEQ